MPIFTALLILLLVASIDAGAQGMSGVPQLSAAELEEARVACEALGKMPNAPMSVESCKAMLGMGARLDSAMNDPAGRRPGDEAMTCAAIFAELQTMAGVGIADASMARADAVMAAGTALANRQAAEMTAFIIETYALGAVMGAVSAVTPNFVGAAIAAAWQARFMGLAARQAAEQAPLRAQVNEAVLANLGELGESLQANPRFARLVHLAMAKSCEPPAMAPR